MKRILYFASPLFSVGEREYNLRVRSILDPYFNVYLPHVDGPFFPDLLAAGLDPAEAKKKIFVTDIEALKRCDLFLINLSGRTVDEGAAFELGVAWNLGKPCYGLKEDIRQLTAHGNNPMVDVALIHIFSDLHELSTWISDNKL